MSQTTINQRIKILIKGLEMSSRGFSASIDVPDATTRNYIDNRAKPSSEYLEKIMRRYAHVNPLWLLTGEGSMLLSEAAEPNVTYQKNKGSNNVGNIGTNNGTSTVTYNSISDCEKDLKSAHEKIAQQSSQLQDKERIIRLLEMQLENLTKPK